MTLDKKALELTVYFSKQWLYTRLRIDNRALINKMSGSTEWTVNEAKTIDRYYNALKQFVKLDNSLVK